MHGALADAGLPECPSHLLRVVTTPVQIPSPHSQSSLCPIPRLTFCHLLGRLEYEARYVVVVVGFSSILRTQHTYI